MTITHIHTPEQAQSTEANLRFHESDRYEVTHFTEFSDPEAAEQAWRIHAEGYASMGFVKPEALIDGLLAPGIDKARGPYIDYYNGINPTNEADGASIRVISIPPGGTLEDLPAFSLCKDSLSDAGHAELAGIESPDINVKEIAAMARTKQAPPKAVFEVIRQITQSHNTAKEAWIFSIVAQTYQAMQMNWGPYAIRQIGEPVALDDDRVNPDIRLVPAIFYPDKFIDSLRAAAQEAIDPRQQQRIAYNFLYSTEGLTDEELSPESAAFRTTLLEMPTAS